MTDKLNDIVPGQQMTPEQREALAKSNMEMSAEAQRLAAEHIQRDIAASGQVRPVVQEVADSVLEKLKGLPVKE